MSLGRVATRTRSCSTTSQGGICAVSLAELGGVFQDCGLTFRHFEDCTVPFMRWQAGRIGCIEVESARGGIFGEAFELIVFASTSSALIERLAELDGRA